MADIANRLEDLGRISYILADLYEHHPLLDAAEMGEDEFMATYLDEDMREELYGHLSSFHKKVLDMYDIAKGEDRTCL